MHILLINAYSSGIYILVYFTRIRKEFLMNYELKNFFSLNFLDKNVKYKY